MHLMKFRSLAIAVLASLAFSAHARYMGPGAVAIPASAATADTRMLGKVVQAIVAPDDSLVMLEGHIIQQQRLRSGNAPDKFYTFKDDTGSVTVEIKPKAMPAQKFDHKTPVRLFGEVDHGRYGAKIDVKRIEIVKS
ncbi:hypothetical protein GCM10027419_39590 [Pandoraea terrae]